MAASPRWKVFNTQNVYVASCKFLEDAAALVNLYGNGATIRDGHARRRAVVWREGSEAQSAGESFDFVRETAEARSVLAWWDREEGR